MRLRWRWILPLVGLLLFGAETYQSWRLHRLAEQRPSRYFWWSSLRLDSRPLDKNPPATSSCASGSEGCATWDLQDTWVEPSVLARVQVLFAFPAFLVGLLTVIGLGKIGINEVLSFVSLMPPSIFAWYYLLGRLVDRRHVKRLTAVQNYEDGAR